MLACTSATDLGQHTATLLTKASPMLQLSVLVSHSASYWMASGTDMSISQHKKRLMPPLSPDAAKHYNCYGQPEERAVWSQGANYYR